MKKEDKHFKIKLITVLVYSVKILITLCIFAMQIGLILFISHRSSLYPYYSTISRIAALIVVLFVCNRHDYPAYKIIWLITIFIFPIAGTFYYILFGHGNTLPKKNYKNMRDYLKNLIPKNKLITSLPECDRKYACIVNSKTNFPIYKNNDTNYFNDGASYFESLLIDIKKAQKSVLIETFLIAEGKMLNRLKEAIIEVANRGVEVKIIFDTFGCAGKFKDSYYDLLHTQNVTIVPFNPPKKWITLSLNYRDHRKIIVIDGEISYIGGVNIADEYVHYIEKYGFWRDGGMKIIGESSKSHVLLFCENWFMATKTKLNPLNYYASSYTSVDNGYIMPFGDCPNNKEDPAYNLYLSLIDSASRCVYISTPYLIIDDAFLDALSRSATSGVDVRILVPGIPDKKLVYLVTRSSYSKLLKAGVKIYEMNNTFNHAKMMMVDDRYILSGSINIDFRSMMLHWENATFFIGDNNTELVKNDFINAFSLSKKIESQEWEKRSFLIKLVEMIMIVFSPLL